MSEEKPAVQLYLVSPPQITELEPFGEQLDAALSVGITGAFQLRLKDDSVALPKEKLTFPPADEAVIAQAIEVLMPVCHRHEVAFILNDSPELAARYGTDGVHLGQEDGSIVAAREVMGEEAVIGVSCHDSRHLAMEAAEQGADYVAFGAFFPTTSKTPQSLAKWGTPTPEMIDWWATYTTVPCVAIGGITPENGQPLIEAGADFLAVITAVWDHPESPEAAVKAFAEYL